MLHKYIQFKILLVIFSPLFAIACAEDRNPSTSSPISEAVVSDTAVVQYTNGLWYDGERFVKRDAFVSDEYFVGAPQNVAVQVVDLEGGYVVPGFAEAHHHTVLCNPERIQDFIDHGIVYAAILNARVSSLACQAEHHPEQGLEIVSALAGVTARNAHPAQIGLYFLEAEEIDGQWVHYVDTAEELDERWPLIASMKSDIIKIFLSYSEDYDLLRADETIPIWYRGLDPALVPSLVDKAHKAGLRVAAHVMSAHDFDVAVSSGVDIIAHLPGFAPGAAFTPDNTHSYLLALMEETNRYMISENAAVEAARRDVVVITTISGGGPPSDIVNGNIAELRRAGVELLIGSDRGEFDSIEESIYLAQHGLVPPQEILNSLAIQTPKFFFSGRKIGRLEVGYEATFNVLRADPLSDLSAIRQVDLVVKRGKTLRKLESK